MSTSSTATSASAFSSFSNHYGQDSSLLGGWLDATNEGKDIVIGIIRYPNFGYKREIAAG